MLATLLPEVTETTWPAMTLRAQPDSSGYALILESHGIGELERIHLAPDGDNTWSINYQGGIGKLLGSVQTTPEDVDSVPDLVAGSHQNELPPGDEVTWAGAVYTTSGA